MEPIWKAYEACGPGAEAKTILGKVVKGLGLQHVSALPIIQSTRPAWQTCATAGHASALLQPTHPTQEGLVLATLLYVHMSAWPVCSSAHVCMQVSDKALAQADPKAALRAVMKSWLPLSEAVLGMAVEQLPDPASAAPERLPRLLALDAMDALDSSLSASAQQVGVVGSCRLPWQQCVLQLKYPRSPLLADVWILSGE